MEAVHILAIVNSFNNLLLADVPRQGKLNDKAVNCSVLIQFLYLFQEECLCYVILETKQRTLESTGLAREYLILYIGLRAAIVPYQYGSQVRAAPPAADHLFNLILNFCFYLGCSSLSVY